MEFLPTISILLALAAVLNCMNEFTLKWESSIGLTFWTLVTALAIAGLGLVGWPIAERAVAFVAQVDFSRTFFHGMLCFLLFAGALDVPIAGGALRPSRSAGIARPHIDEVFAGRRAGDSLRSGGTLVECCHSHCGSSDGKQV